MKGLLNLSHCLRFLILVFIVGTSSTGCVPMDYRPNERAVQHLGLPEAVQRLREILLRSVDPQVIDASVTNDGLSYRYKAMIRTGLGIPVGWTDVQEKLIAFTNVSKVEVFENHTVYVRGAGGQVIATLVCASDQDAKTFADLLMSFRGQYLRDRASFQSPPIPR